MGEFPFLSDLENLVWGCREKERARREGAGRSSPFPPSPLFLFVRRYTNPNYRPVYYSELVDPTEKGEDFRKRYWSRGEPFPRAEELRRVR